MRQFDKQNLVDLRKSIDCALALVSSQYGIDLSIGNITFEANRFTTRLTAKTRNIESTIMNNVYFLRNNGLPSDLIGKQFLYKGTSYRVNGINERKRKYPIETIRLKDNKSIIFTSEVMTSSEITFI